MVNKEDTNGNIYTIPSVLESDQMKNKTLRKGSSESKLRKLVKELLAEFLGTYMLMLIGCTSTASFVLNLNNKEKSIDSFGLSYCWGFAAFIGISSSMAISGGHINPAVSIAFASISRFPWSKVGPYILIQIIGSFMGTATSYLVYSEAITAQHNLEPLINRTDLRAFGHPLSTGGIFATYPSPHVSVVGVLIDQIIATASLLISVMVIVDKNNLNVPMILQPFLLAFVIATHGLAFGFNCGAALNPARDFGPRLFTSMAGWGLHVFRPLNGNYWWSGGIVGPIIGAVLGVWIYYFVIEYFNTSKESDVEENNLNANELKPL